MDRSFLSDQQVIDASRAFVCIRLATYEDAAEAEVLSRVFVGREGTLENTVFGILSPDGETALVRSGRSPDWAFRDARDMAARMHAIAQRFTAAESDSLPLPRSADVRLALNVAACDSLPLAVVVADEEARRVEIESALAERAWQDEFLGQFVYAVAESATELHAVGVDEVTEGVVILQPGTFGLTATVLARATETDAPALDAKLRSGIEAHQPVHKSDIRQHRRLGERTGIYWETAIPVTDSHGPPPRARRKDVERPAPPTPEGGKPRPSRLHDW